MNPYGSSRTFLGSVWGMILGLKYGLVPSQTVAMDLSPPHPRSPAVLCGAAVRGGREPAAWRSIRIVEERQTNTVLSCIHKIFRLYWLCSIYLFKCLYIYIYIIYSLFINFICSNTVYPSNMSVLTSYQSTSSVFEPRNVLQKCA